MPRKRVTTKVEESFDANATETNETEETQGDLTIDDSEGIQQYLGQFGPTPFKVKVYRVGSNGHEYCFQGSTDVDEEKIKSFGGGQYELRVFVNGVKQDTIHLKIADRPLSEFARPNVPQTAGDSSFEMRMMREQMDFLKSMLLNRNNSSTPIGELVDAVKAVNGLGGSSTGDPISLLMKGIELAKEIGVGGGSGDWKSTLIDSVKDIAKAVAPAMIAQSKNVELPMSQESMLKAGIGFLKNKAISGMPVDMVIDWVRFNANDTQYLPFIQLVLQQEFQAFITLDAEIAQEPYLTWFRTLHSGLRDAFNESVNGDDSPGTTGNVRDITDNVSTSTKGRKHG